MEKFTEEELREASRAIASMISKCEKVQDKDSLGASQKSLLRNRIKALKISAALITDALGE